MGGFVDSVRKSLIRQPTQRDFSIAAWTAAYRAFAAHDETDEELFAAGPWFFAKLQTIRMELAKHALPTLDRSERLRLTVAMVNFARSDVERRRTPTVTPDISWAEEMAQGQPCGLPGSSERMDIVIEQILDAAGHALAHAAKPGEAATSVEPVNDARVVEALKRTLSLGALYDTVEGYWCEVLWRGWRLVQDGDVTVMAPPADERAVEMAVSGYRRDLQMIRSAMSTVVGWRDLPPEAKAKLSETTRVEIVGSGKRRRYMSRRVRAQGKTPPTPVLFRMVSHEEYYDALYSLPLPTIPGVTLRQVLDAWEMLYALSSAHAERFPTCLGHTSLRTLRQYAPLIAKTTLCGLISRAASGVSWQVASDIVDFLTFRPGKGAELWATPLVRIDGDLFAWAISPILEGNLLRATEIWLKRAGVDMGTKGGAFERYVRARLSASCACSHLLKDCGAFQRSLILEAEGHREEIDIALWIGSTVLLGELKCVHLPSEALERNHYYDSLDRGAAQIRRKVDLANRHRDLLRERLGLREPPDRVIPFVLTNQPFGVGFDRGAVPITDVSTLASYLEGGCLHCGVRFQIDRGLSEPVFERRYYSTPEEAEANIEGYLRKPPEVADFERCVQIRTYHWEPVNESDAETAVRRPEVRLTMEENTPVPCLAEAGATTGSPT